MNLLTIELFHKKKKFCVVEIHQMEKKKVDSH